MIDVLYRLPQIVLTVCTLAAAAMIVVAVGRRPTTQREPLGFVLVVLLLAFGTRAAVRAGLDEIDALAPAALVPILVVDWLAAATAVAFLALRGRYATFVESAHIVREYETGYAAKEREARSLAQINEELRRLDELKSEFLAMVSHELRTPLTAILGYSRLLVRQVHGPLTEKQLEHQEAILRSAQRLTDLINDLLDVSRLEAARIELNPRPTDVREVVGHVIAAVRVAAQAKQIRIANEIPAPTPPVLADATRLHQILVNLIGNAVKFTPEGGSVRVGATPQDGKVWISVEDSGVGIPRQELSRIWDPFYQVESPMRRRHGGSGLGLAIVRRLVELHGGLVRAESEGEGRGSRFSFSLPVAREPVPAPVAEVPAQLGPVLAGREVLIVEDDDQNRALMRAVVEDVLGGMARVCADGERAVDEAAARPPALILLDLMLPGVSGWEVARRLRQNPETRAVPVIAVSALARSQEREAALHAGCDAYVSKPFTPDELGRAIAATLVGEAVGAR